MKISTKQLEAFFAFMKSGTVTSAAERLGVSQPAVSRMLDRFQHEAGFKVFEKEGNRISPTSEAEVFFEEVRHIYQGLDYINDIAREIRENRRGHLRIGVFPALANKWITSKLTDFISSDSNILISITPLSSPEIIDAVSRQTMDLGITTIPSEHDNVDCEKLLTMDAVCITPRGYKLGNGHVVRPQDFEGHAFISLSSLDNSRTKIDTIFDEAGTKRRINLEVAQVSSVCHMVSHGMGVSIVTNYAAEEYRDLGLEIRPFEPTLQFHTYIVSASKRPYSRLCQSFKAAIYNNTEQF